METSIRSFVPLDKLGEGSFASVYKVQRVCDHQIYALKKVPLPILRSGWAIYLPKLKKMHSTKFAF